MKVRIHYEVGDYEDSFDIEGETELDIQAIIETELKRRGLDPDKNMCWSEDFS